MIKINVVDIDVINTYVCMKFDLYIDVLEIWELKAAESEAVFDLIDSFVIRRIWDEKGSLKRLRSYWHKKQILSLTLHPASSVNVKLHSYNNQKSAWLINQLLLFRNSEINTYENINASYLDFKF